MRNPGYVVADGYMLCLGCLAAEVNAAIEDLNDPERVDEAWVAWEPDYVKSLRDREDHDRDLGAAIASTIGYSYAEDALEVLGLGHTYSPVWSWEESCGDYCGGCTEALTEACFEWARYVSDLGHDCGCRELFALDPLNFAELLDREFYVEDIAPGGAWEDMLPRHLDDLLNGELEAEDHTPDCPACTRYAETRPGEGQLTLSETA